MIREVPKKLDSLFSVCVLCDSCLILVVRSEVVPPALLVNDEI